MKHSKNHGYSAGLTPHTLKTVEAVLPRPTMPFLHPLPQTYAALAGSTLSSILFVLKV